MDRSSVAYLINSTTTQDSYGVWREILTKRRVFCNVSSVTRAEFFEAGRNGFNPQYQLTMLKWDYQGESAIEYNGEVYAIYRTYERRNDEIELYCERKGGTNARNTTVVMGAAVDAGAGAGNG